MKKGSRALKCSFCGKHVGWEVPNGKVHHGIPEVEFKMNEGCGWTINVGYQKYYCKECKPSHLN